MMSTDERLAYMADQIVRNFAALGEARAIAATAEHIATFWDPRMKQQAFALLEGERPKWMSDVAVRSLSLLRDRAGPASQILATEVDGLNEKDQGDERRRARLMAGRADGGPL